MTIANQHDLRSSFKAFAESTSLDVFLAGVSGLDISSIIKSDGHDKIATLPARRNFFYDEDVNFYTIAKTNSTLDVIREIVRDLDISIAAYATDAVPEGTGNTASASGKYDMTAETHEASQDHEIVETPDFNFLIWKHAVSLPRPRVRLQRPAVYFTVSLSLRKTSLQASTSRLEKTTLTSYEGLPANVLEPLQFDSTLSDKHVYLPDVKVTKVAPTMPLVDSQIKPIRGATKRAYPIVPALYTRLRCSPAPEAVIVSLHVEISPFTKAFVSIEDVSLDISDGNVKDLLKPSWPFKAQAGDENVFLFQAAAVTGSSDRPQLAHLQIAATVHVDASCKAKLNVPWQSHIDLAQALPNPAYRWSRPLSTHSQTHRISVQSQRPLSSGSTSSSRPDNGIVFNFSRSQSTFRGAEMPIDIQCINRTNSSRRFAIINLQPKKIRHTSHRPPSLITHKTDTLTEILNSSPAERMDPSDVLDITPEIRIGPLPPGTCYETRWNFKVNKSGILDMGVFRIVDLDSMQTVDVKRLPEILSLEDLPEDVMKPDDGGSIRQIATHADWSKLMPLFAISSVNKFT